MSAPTLTDRVWIAGIGTTALARKSARADEEVVVEACRSALADAGIDAGEVDGINVQSHHAPGPDVGAIVRTLGLKQIGWAPEGGIGVEGLAAAGAAVASGRVRATLVCKVMNTASAVNVPMVDADTRLVSGRDQFELPYGIGYTVQRAALVQRRWMSSRRVSPAQLGTLCVVQREHAMLNPNAVFRTPLTLADYLDSRIICDPVRLYDCDYPINGAYAYLVVGDRTIVDGARSVAVRGWTTGGPDDMPHIRREGRPGIRPDVAGLYAALGIGPADLSALMLYDGFSFLAAEWIERLGVVGPDEIGAYLADPGNLRFDGTTPVNTHGGQLSEGRMHGAGHLIEAVRQLRGEAGPRQVGEARLVAVTTAFPATGAVAVLERGR